MSVNPITEDPKTGAIIHDHIYVEAADATHRICLTDTNVNEMHIPFYRFVYTAYATPRTAAKFLQSNLPFVIENV